MARQRITAVFVQQLVRSAAPAVPHSVKPHYKNATVGPQQVSAQDRQHMKHALTLAKKGLGKTYPNPAVGCVIVDQGKVQSHLKLEQAYARFTEQQQAEYVQVIGEGYHPKAGEPHAEVFALRAAGIRHSCLAATLCYLHTEPAGTGSFSLWKVVSNVCQHTGCSLCGSIPI